MIAVIDYGIGNIFNVLNQFNHLSSDVVLSKSKEEILNASHIILPGVGAFRDAIEALKNQGLDKVILEAADKNIPILGICLGMQLLYEESFENGHYKGLGLLKGSIDPLPSDKVKRIPQIGWNTLERVNPSIFNDVQGEVYFVHSYFANAVKSEIYMDVNYDGVKVPAVVGRDNIFGMQFHPEKSAKVGSELLECFLKLRRSQ